MYIIIAVSEIHQLERGDPVLAVHKNRKCCKIAVEKLITLPATTPDVGELLSSSLAQERAKNRQCVMKVLNSLKFITWKKVLKNMLVKKNNTFLSLVPWHGFYLCQWCKLVI